MASSSHKRAQFKKLKSSPTLTTGRRLAEKQSLAQVPLVIERLKAWRAANRLSQRLSRGGLGSSIFPSNFSQYASKSGKSPHTPLKIFSLNFPRFQQPSSTLRSLERQALRSGCEAGLQAAAERLNSSLDRSTSESPNPLYPEFAPEIVDRKWPENLPQEQLSLPFDKRGSDKQPLFPPLPS
jgi:transcriptional regulator with XRE-family HTH domain